MSHSFSIDTKQYVIPPSFFRVSIKLMVRDADGRALLVRNKDDGSWCLPGGGWDYGETVEQCIRREIQEELGVDIKHIDATPVGFWDGKNSKYDYRALKLVITGQLASDQFTVTDEASEVGYFNHDEMKRLDFNPDEIGVVELCR